MTHLYLSTSHGRRNVHRWTQRSRGGKRLAIAAAVAAMAVAAGCGSDDGGGGANDPIKIGILAPYSGVFAQYGPKVIEDPIRLWLDEHGGKLAGRRVEIVTADDQSKPDVELEKAKELVDSEDVDAIVGIVNSAGALAVRNYLDQKKVPTMITVAGAAEITGERKSDYIFRVSFANGQTEAAGAVLAREAGIERTAGIGADYVAGHEILEPLEANFKQLGGSVAKTVWPPLDTADFSSYLSQLRSASGDVDAIMPMLFGADAVRFIDQYRSFNIDAPLYAFGDVMEQTLFLDAVGEKAKGARTYWYYSPYLKNPENEKFRKSFLAAYKRLPGAFSMQSYSTMTFLDEAGATINGDLSDPDALVGALEKTAVDSPAGTLRFDDNHQVIWPSVFLNEVRKDDHGNYAQFPLGPVVTDVAQGQTVEEAQASLKTDGASGN